MATYNFTIRNNSRPSETVIIEWEAPGLTRNRWKLMIDAIRDLAWDGSNGSWTGILSVDGRAVLALLWIVTMSRYHETQYGELRLIRLRQWQPVGGDIIRSYITAD